MTPSDADEVHAQDDGAPPRWRARREVLEIGRGGRRSGGRGAEHDRDLDIDENDGDSRRSRADDRRRDDRDGDRIGNRRRDDRKLHDDADGDAHDEKEAGDKDRDKKGNGKHENKDVDEAQDRRKSRRPLIITNAVILAVLLIGFFVYYNLSDRGKAGTDDAYTGGYLVAVAPRVSGRVVSLDIVDNQFVHKGDSLVHIDPRSFTFSRDQAKGQPDALRAQIQNQKLGVEIAMRIYPAAPQLAQANLLPARANLSLQEQNNRRQQNLPKQATTQQEVDTTTSGQQQAEAAVAQAQARVTQAEPVQQSIGQSQQQVDQLQGQAEQAQAQLDNAEFNLDFTVVRAAQDGWVTRRNVDAGNYVTAGTQIPSLVTPAVRVTANYKETELDGMTPGQPVSTAVDAYPDLKLTGPRGFNPARLGLALLGLPGENATGNFVKVVQRVPVKYVIDSGLKQDQPLPLSANVEPTVVLR